MRRPYGYIQWNRLAVVDAFISLSRLKANGLSIRGFTGSTQPA